MYQILLEIQVQLSIWITEIINDHEEKNLQQRFLFGPTTWVFPKWMNFYEVSNTLLLFEPILARRAGESNHREKIKLSSQYDHRKIQKSNEQPSDWITGYYNNIPKKLH